MKGCFNPSLLPFPSAFILSRGCQTSVIPMAEILSLLDRAITHSIRLFKAWLSLT